MAVGKDEHGVHIIINERQRLKGNPVWAEALVQVMQSEQLGSDALVMVADYIATLPNDDLPKIDPNLWHEVVHASANAPVSTEESRIFLMRMNTLRERCDAVFQLQTTLDRDYLSFPATLSAVEIRLLKIECMRLLKSCQPGQIMEVFDLEDGGLGVWVCRSGVALPEKNATSLFKSDAHKIDEHTLLQ